MHKKILLALDRNQFENFNYNLDFNSARASLGGNSGNNVFQYSLQKLLTNSNNDVCVSTSFFNRSKSIDFDYINNNFDCLVYSPANILSDWGCILLNHFGEVIKKIKIPVYVLGLGAQSDKFYSLEFIKKIKKSAYNYIKAILDTGGRIGLRGYFTAEVVKACGFKETDFTVIGCPSLYLKGADLKVSRKALTENDIIPAINGFRAWRSSDIGKYFMTHPQAIYICQEEFYKLLYMDCGYDWKEFQYLQDVNKKFFNMYKKSQIKLYGDFQSWYNDIIDKDINFSFGCRIHGNIVPILAGIPAFIDAFDSRVKELAEYFEIPNDYLKSGFDDPVKLYERADFNNFNKNFASKYEHFNKFMNSCGLYIEPAKQITRDYKLPLIKNGEYIDILNQKLSKPLKVVFAAHEFGLYNKHGGIASYLYNICSWLLKLPDIQVYVFAENLDKKCDLLSNSRFHLIHLKGSIRKRREFIFKSLLKINPNYVEFADFRALGLKSVIEKKYNGKLSDTILVTNNHTATRECFEWTNLEDFASASKALQDRSNEEGYQMRLSDYCIAPSSFLAVYVRKQYHLASDVLVFANPYFKKLKTKNEIKKELSKTIDFGEFDKSFNIVLITRFERRKQQEKLVKAVKNLITEGLNIKLILTGNANIMKDGKDYREYIFNLASNTKGIYMFDFANLQAQEKYIAAADLTVLPSTFENQPVAMIETVLRGVPVMASRYSGIADYTKNSELLFDPFEPDDLQNKIREFYMLSENKRETLRLAQYLELKKFIDPEKCIIDRINLKLNNEPLNYEKNMELLVK